MASLYNVGATLTANPTRFVRGFQRASASVELLHKQLNRINGAMMAQNSAFARSALANPAIVNNLGRTADKTREVNRAMRDGVGQANGLSKATGNVSRNMNTASHVANMYSQDLDRFNRTARGFAYTGIVAGVTSIAAAFKSLETFGNFEQALAGVNKTLDLTERELRGMDKAFMAMSRSIPVTYEEIAGVAEIAGQLGIEKQHIESFTDTMVRMGSSTNLSAEDAAMAISRLSNIMGTSQGKASRWGSTIVELGNNLATTEQEIVDMSLRIAGMGKALGMTESDILALSATLSSLGIRAEMGGSAISTIMSKTASEISRGTEAGQKWAEVMGMSIDEVSTLFEKDAYGALIKMVEGLEKVDASGGNLDQTLRDLGINEIRQLDVMKRLIGASDDLADSQNMANGEWEENNALLEESAKRYETFFSQVQMAWNGVRNIFKNIGEVFVLTSGEIGEAIVGVIDKIEAYTAKFVDLDGNVTEVGETFVRTAKKIAGISAILGIAGAAFLTFGIGGVVAVGTIAGLAAIGYAVIDLLDQFGLIPESIGGNDVESAIRLIERSSDEATAKAASNYVRLKDEALQALGDLATQSGEEAEKSRKKIVEQFEIMSKEVIEAIEGDRQALNTAIAGLMEGATEPERQALEKARKNIEKHYDEQLKLAQNYTKTVSDVMNNHIDETGRITDEGMRRFNAAAQGMDQLFGTSIAKSQQEMSRFKSAFDRAFSERDIKKAQENLTGIANSTVDSISELNKAYEEQKNAIEATDAPLKEKELVLQGLDKQYKESKLALLDNLAAHESEAKTLDDSISAIAKMSDAQLEKLGVTREEYAQMVLTSGALRNNADENHNLASALDAAKDAASRSTEEYSKLVDEFNKFDIGKATVVDALGAIRDATEEEAYAIGEAFATTMADGTQAVDMGSYGTLTVEEFVDGVRSKEITSKEAGIALTNVLREGLGQESLTEAGQKQVEDYVSGLQSKNVTVEDVAKSLGYATADGVQVNLEGEAAMNIETFVDGLKSGEYGVFEVAQILMRNLETTMSKDFSQYGEEDMATFAAGIESGMIPTDAAIELITNSLNEGMIVDLGPQGEQSVGSWIDKFTNGEIEIQEFVSGLETFLGEGTYFDLSESGTGTADSYTSSLNEVVSDSTQIMNELGPKLKESANIDLSTEGGNTTGTFAIGIGSRMEEVLQKSSEIKNSTENILGSTTDGGGGENAGSLLNVGFINWLPNILHSVGLGKSGVETELGSTTDGGGGLNSMSIFSSTIMREGVRAKNATNSVKGAIEGILSRTSDGGGGNKAGNEFNNGLVRGGALAKATSDRIKSATSRTLGSTTDGKGGHSVGNMFNRGLSSHSSPISRSASSIKSNTSRTLGSATDGKGGTRVGSQFTSGISSYIGRASATARSMSGGARNAVASNTNTYGLGQNFGSGFVRGISSFVGSAVRAAANLARSALNAVRNAQRSASPSKETMKLGQYFGDGFSLAIEQSTKNAVKSATNLANEAMGALDNAFNTDYGLEFNSAFSGVEVGRTISNQVNANVSLQDFDKQKLPININIYDNKEAVRTYIAEQDAVDALIRRFDS